MKRDILTLFLFCCFLGFFKYIYIYVCVHAHVYVCVYISPQEYFYQTKNLSIYVPSKSQATAIVVRLQVITVLKFHWTHFSFSKTIYCNDMKGNILQQNFSYL